MVSLRAGPPSISVDRNPSALTRYNSSLIVTLTVNPAL